MGDLSQFLLQISQITHLQMESFAVAILYLVYFALYLHFGKFRNMVEALCDGNSRISENEDNIKFVSSFSGIRKQPSSSPKTQRFAKKKHLIWSICAQRAPFVIYTPIYGVTTLC